MTSNSFNNTISNNSIETKGYDYLLKSGDNNKIHIIQKPTSIPDIIHNKYYNQQAYWILFIINIITDKHTGYYS